MKNKNIITTLVLLALSFVVTLGIGYYITSPSVSEIKSGLGSNKAASYFNMCMNSYLSDVVGTENRLTLPYDTSAAPVPNPDNFSTITSNGIKKQIYEDSTISAVVWKETLTRKVGNRNRKSEYTFADVQISDASQFRRGWSNGKPLNPTIMPPTDIFKKYHGVVGMSSDFYSFRDYGIIYQYGQEICYKKSWKDGRKLDILVVDYNGDLSTYSYDDFGKEVEKRGKEFTDTIMFSFTFGPILVKDGKNTHSPKFKTQKLGEITHAQPRACIGQLGPLHYLLVTVGEPGCDMEVLADEMVARGCITAYNLDGGQSGTLLFKDKSINTIAYSKGKDDKYGERAQDSIIYFGTALQ